MLEIVKIVSQKPNGSAVVIKTYRDNTEVKPVAVYFIRANKDQTVLKVSSLFTKFQQMSLPESCKTDHSPITHDQRVAFYRP